MSDREEADEKAPSSLSFRLGGGGGRFRAPDDSGDLSVYSPDEEEGLSAAAKRFRNSPRLGAPASDAVSLDLVDDGDDIQIDAGSLLSALEAEPAPEPMVENTQARSGDASEVEEIPMVAVEPLSTATERVAVTPVVCLSCNAENPPGMRFCVECGGALKKSKSSVKADPGFGAEPIVEVSRKPPPPSKAATEENPWAIRLVSINEDGSDGTVVPLEFLETTVGRDGDSRFPTDGFLSPKHARFHIEKGKLFIEDLYSLNGTFIKLRDETRLTPGDTILMGRQVLRFERFEQTITPKTKSSDGTRYMGSPSPGGNFKILQIGIGGVIQNVYCLPEAGAVLGREKGDIVFPHDKFMSGRHAQIYSGDDGHCYLVDLNSSNGTWVKIWEKTALDNKDYIFMGQQLFRVHYDR